MKQNLTIPRQREIWDISNLKMALLDLLNKQGCDLEVSEVNAKRLHVTCNRTHNRFVIECLGHKDWPEETSQLVFVRAE